MSLTRIRLLIILIQIIYIISTECHAERKSGLNAINENNVKKALNFYTTLLKDMKAKHDFSSLLMVVNSPSAEQDIQAIYELNIPKIILHQRQMINLAKYYNSNFLSVIVLSLEMDNVLMDSLALTLNHMRQTRILVIALNMTNRIQFEMALLKSCEMHKMTNVIVHFSAKNQKPNQWFLLLKPYPLYHWQSITKPGSSSNDTYYKQHWRNMENSTLITLPDQYMQNSLVYKDHQGQTKLKGMAAQMVLLFGDIYNAHVKLAHDVLPGQVINLYEFANLTQQNIVHMPMSYHPIVDQGTLTRFAYPMQIGRIHIMVPCAQQLHVNEVFGIIITKNCFACILGAILLFSVLHTIIDYVSEGSFDIFNIFLNVKVINGVLGQSLTLKLTSMMALKLVYFLIFLLGLNVNTLFGAHLKTLVTSPPYHAQIKTIDDLTNSSVKLLFDSKDITPYSLTQLQPFVPVLALAENTTVFQNSRKSMNTKYAYTVPDSSWGIFKQQQVYFNEKLFWTPPDIFLSDYRIYSTILADNSPLLEPLDYLIHWAHDLGFPTAWQSDAFLDMIKYKNITRSHFSIVSGYKDINEDDLRWIWMFLLVGLAASIMVFLLELLVKFWQTKLFWNKFRIWRSGVI